MIKCSSILNRDKMKRSFFNIFFNFSLVLFSLCTNVLLMKNTKMEINSVSVIKKLKS